MGKVFRFMPVAVSCALLSVSVHAADFQKGLDAVVKGDFATAYGEWSQLAEEGHTDAQFNLGMMYANGDGVPQSDAEAIKWWREAAMLGHGGGQIALAQSYAHGIGIARDYTAAYVWYDMATRIGDGNAKKERRKTARKLSSGDLEKAKALADSCFDSNFRDCP